MAGGAPPEPAVIRSSLLGAAGSAGPPGELEPMMVQMPMKIPIRVPTKPHCGREGAQPLEWSDEDQPTTGGTLTPDSCRRSANGQSTPPDTSECFSACGGKAAYLAPSAAPTSLPPGLGQSQYGFGTPFDVDPFEASGSVIDRALVMQGIDPRYTAESLQEEIYHSGFCCRRDILFFHLPCDAAGANAGRCFLAFDAVSTRNQFIAAWEGKRLPLARGADAVSFATLTTKDVLNLFTDSKAAISEEPLEAPAARAVSEQVSKFCTRCGTRVSAGDRFCAACGAPVRRQ